MHFPWKSKPQFRILTGLVASVWTAGERCGQGKLCPVLASIPIVACFEMGGTGRNYLHDSKLDYCLGLPLKKIQKLQLVQLARWQVRAVSAKMHLCYSCCICCHYASEYNSECCFWLIESPRFPWDQIVCSSCIISYHRCLLSGC